MPPKAGAVITEVVVQGVRRFVDVRRFNLGPGYNVVYGLSAAGKSTLSDVFASLLFMRPEEGEDESFRSTDSRGGAACRAGMTLTMGGETFRILKDYLQGSVTLSRLNAEKKFELIYSDSNPIKKWLSEHAKLSVGPAFGPLFALAKNDLPSTLEAKLGGVMRSALDPAFEQHIAGLSVQEKKKLLQKLADDFRRQAEIKTTEFLQDGLRGKMFEVDSLLRKRDEIRESMAALDAELDPIAKLPRLPKDFEEKLEAYKRMEKTRESEMGDLMQRQADAHASLDLAIPAPFSEEDFRKMRSPPEMITGLLKKDFIIDGGLAGFLAGFVMAALLARPYNMLGILLVAIGAGLILWRGLLVFLKAKESFDKLRVSVDQIDEHVRMIEKKWDIETTVIRNLMKAYGVEDARDMIEIDRKRDTLASQKKDLQTQIDALRMADGSADIDGVKARYMQQIGDIDKRLAELGGGGAGADAKELEPQIERLDREVARAEGRRPTPRAKLFGREEDQADAEADIGGGMTTLVESWCSARSADSQKLLRAIQEAYGKNLRALSGGRYSDASFDAAGTVRVREDGRPPVAYESLDAIGKDAAYLSLRLTLFQLETRGASRLVAVLDDPFEYEEGRLLALSRALKSLGHDAQVVHLTSRPIHAKLADVNLEI